MYKVRQLVKINEITKAILVFFLSFCFSVSVCAGNNSKVDGMIFSLLPPPSFDNITNINVNVAASRVSGELFVDGDLAPKNTVADARFSLLLHDDTTSLSPLANWSDREFDISLINGTYTAVFSPIQGALMPLNLNYNLDKKVVVKRDVHQSLNVTTIDVTPIVTLNGEVPPALDGTNANIFLRAKGSNQLIYVGNIQNTNSHHKIMPGMYDIIYQYLAGNDIPTNSFAVVKKEVELTKSGEFKVAIAAGTVRSIFRLNDQAFPNSGLDYARFYLVSESGDEVFLGNSNEVFKGDTHVIAGIYNVHYRFRESQTIPVNRDKLILKGVKIKNDFNLLPINVHGVEISGVITVNKVAAPASGLDYAHIYLRDMDTGSSLRIGQTSDGSYPPIRIVAGKYDVIYDFRESSSLMPAQNNTLIKRQLFNEYTKHSIDIRTAVIDLNLTLNGEPFPKSGLDFGWIVLKEESSDTTLRVGYTNQEMEPITLLHGIYTFFLEVREFGESMPSNPKSVFMESTVVDQDISIDYNFVSTKVRVIPTLNNTAFPFSDYSSAEILFGKNGQTPFKVAITGATPIVRNVLQGEYDVFYNRIEEDKKRFTKMGLIIKNPRVRKIPINQNTRFTKVTIN